MKALISICSWCVGSREKTLAAIAQGHDVTHGICPDCQVKVEAEMESHG